MVVADIRYFLEAHHYSGGLRHFAFARDGNRPTWAPSPDGIGFHDEVALGEQDYVIEFARRKVDAHEVTWIAVYRRSIDKAFGDRNNHAGVGLWMCDIILSDALSLISGLQKFATQIALGARPQESITDSELFLSDRYVGKYIMARASFPSSMVGAPCSTSELYSTAVVRVDGEDLGRAMALISLRIAELSLATAGRVEHARTLFHIAIQSTPAIAGKPLPTLQWQDRIVDRFLRDMAGAFADMIATESSMRTTLAQTSTALQAEQSARAKLHSDYTNLSARFEAQTSELSRITALDPRVVALEMGEKLDRISMTTRETLDQTQSLGITIRALQQETRAASIVRPTFPTLDPIAPTAPFGKTRAGWRSYVPGWTGAIWAIIAIIVVALAALAVFLFLTYGNTGSLSKADAPAPTAAQTPAQSAPSPSPEPTQQDMNSPSGAPLEDTTP